MTDLTAERLREIACKLIHLHDCEADKMAAELQDAAARIDGESCTILLSPADIKRARCNERERIARHLHDSAVETIKAKDSDGIDGYIAAVIIDLAEVIKNNGEIDAGPGCRSALGRWPRGRG